MEITQIKGIGPKRALLFNNAGIHQVEDLVLDLPLRYEDRSRLLSLEQLKEGGSKEKATVHARLDFLSRVRFFGKNRSFQRALFSDPSGSVAVFFYNQPYLSSTLHVGSSYYLFGSYYPEKEAIMNPRLVKETDQEKREEFFTIQPIYSLPGGLSQPLRIKAAKEALKMVDLNQFEIIDQNVKKDPIIKEMDWILSQLHFPSSMSALREANLQMDIRRALISYVLRKKIQEDRSCQEGYLIKKRPMDEFLLALPFSFTPGQKAALHEILSDLTAKRPMNRLLQGDVGSGKTAIAFGAAYLTLKNGYQVAMMAPTEILAAQHEKKASLLFQKLGYPVTLLTGSSSKKQQEEALIQAKDPRPRLFIGTHSLFQDRMTYAHLGLVITDEQHRFGVRARSKLQKKAKILNTLVLSATPIPRTLQLVSYGDLDLTRLRDRPPGRKPIQSYVVGRSYENRIFAFIEKHQKMGEKAYFICPLIEKNENSKEQAYSIEEVMGRAEKYFQGRIKIARLTGRIKGEEKEKLMEDFSEGSTDLLISTTVVEVGVDVKEATIMVVGGAERFGLSQLHQIRGRVGRGERPSYCIFILNQPTKEATERLKFLAGTEDGFEIAQKDLSLRGGGRRFGTSQHGFSLWGGEEEKERKKEAQREAERILDQVYQNDLTKIQNPFKKYIDEFLSHEGDIALN